ncbi:hypothetical protein ACHQM5_014979 [Ranunculus cassubicifolius]
MFPSMGLLCIYLIILLGNVKAVDNAHESQLSKFRIGVTVDYTSRVGKEQTTAVKMAIDDYYNYTTNKPSLHMKHAGEGPASTVFSVIDLINKTQVNVIIGLSMQNKHEFIAEICSKAEVPVLALEDATPVWVSKRWPFLIPATHKDYEQTRAVAAIIGTWQWRIVNVIYEDVISARLSIFPHLVDALNEVGARVENFLALTLSDFSVAEKLLNLVHKQSRVFIVHTSLPLANLLFQEAKKLGLMEKDSVWIITNTISNLVDVVDTSLFTTMQGFVGVKNHFPEKGARIEYFISRFRSRFHLQYPEEQYLAPSIYALQAYDAVWAVAHARERRRRSTNVDGSSEHLTPPYGKTLLDNIYRGHFEGLTGEFRYINGELAPLPRFEVINVVGNGYKQLGIWSVNFSQGVNMSMGILREVLWPGGILSPPRGWSLPTSENPLLIGVPYHPPSHPFACVIYNPGREPTFNGFSSDVFKAVAQNLPYHLEYKIVPFNDSYDALVKRVYHKDGVRRVDAVVGDIAILSSRSQYAEFSLPWADSGLQMVVLRKSLTVNTAWLFKKPYTNGMWGLTAGITVYNGLVVWLMERTNHQELNGSSWNNFGALIWLAFSTFFSLQGDRLHNNLSRATILVWLFVSVIIIQSYTAKLTSILTLPNFQHKYITVESLKTENAKVGCDNGSFVINYLETVLGFKSKNIIPFQSHDDYIQALKSKEIKAAFLEVPYVKFLRKKYCNKLEVVGETFNDVS